MREDTKTLLEQARTALEEERWQELLTIVKQLQAQEPEAARPFIEALWDHIFESRRERQSRAEQALELRRSAREGHWKAVWETVQALAKEDYAGARHVARLLFVHSSYFTGERPQEKVHRPAFWVTLLRPFEVRLYRYGYGTHSLDAFWGWGYFGAMAVALILATASLVTAIQPVWRLPLALVGWVLGWLFLWANRDGWGDSRFWRWFWTGLPALWLALWLPWENTDLSALLALTWVMYLLAGWAHAWLGPPAAWWAWGTALGAILRRTLPPMNPLLPALGTLLAFLVVATVAMVAAELAHQRFWSHHKATPWYLALLLLGYVGLLAAVAQVWI